MSADDMLPTLEHAGLLDDLAEPPGYVTGGAATLRGAYSCCFCGMGESGVLVEVEAPAAAAAATPAGYRRALSVADSSVRHTAPTAGCVKLKTSLLRQRPAFPIHVAPSVREAGGGRRTVAYAEAIGRLVDLLLAHRAPAGRTLVYACGQVDYFTVFAMQEVFRLLGVRNLTGNAEHCLNAGAVHNEMLTGQEGPFLTVEQGLQGDGRVYLLNGWNGFVTHPPAFHAIVRRPDLDAWLVEVMMSESAKALALKLGSERVLLVRPRSDPHLALAVAHEVFRRHPQAVERRFVERFADAGTFKRYADLAAGDDFAPAAVARRIAPEEQYVERLHRGIERIAATLVRDGVVPINIPSVGLSQTSGVVAHCLWGNLLAALGKYGLRPDGTPAGGTLRLPGQINAESEVQGLSRKYFMGRVPVDDAAEAARRMGLPADAYEAVRRDAPRAALDYADESPGVKELVICFGTQSESNMMERRRWLAKLEHPDTTLVIVDPIPDRYSVEHAALIVPSPPHPAVAKLYQNGEWKLSLSIPAKRAAPETRSDATILYDAMAEIGRRLAADAALATAHPDLARHAASGYLAARFGEGLARVEGEASRPQLFARVQDYLGGGSGPLYCRFEHADGRPIEWAELLERGAIVYGGVGTTRYVLDYDREPPFRDVYRRPRPFTFFVPEAVDLAVPDGVILNSGRSSLSEDAERVRFAIGTFNSGKSTPLAGMPDDNPLHVSPALAARVGLRPGGRARIANPETGQTLELPVVVTDRVPGDTVYVSFHKSRAELEEGRYLNTVTGHTARCRYSSQTSVKATPVTLEPLAPAPGTVEVVDTTLLDPEAALPRWEGQTTTLYVTDVIQETRDVYTFRFQGKPLCRFVYWPGQFCTLVLNIDGKKVVRSYTISSTPSRPFILEITVKRVPGGLVSNWLPDQLKVGDRVEIAGPKGKFSLVPGRIPRKMLFIAGGSGVTPMMAMSRWLCDVSADVDVRFFFSVRTPEDIIFRKEIELLTARYRAFTPLLLTLTRSAGSDWTGYTGQVQRHMLEALTPDLHEREVYLCGPEGFMDAVKRILAELGFDPARLHVESFGGVRTSAADKTPPAAVAGTRSTRLALDGGAAPAGAITLEFARSGKRATTDGRAYLLDVAEAQDVDIGYACRAGSCGECKVRLLSGRVTMECEDGLSAADREAGYVLTCVGRAQGDVRLDA